MFCLVIQQRRHADKAFRQDMTNYAWKQGGESISEFQISIFKLGDQLCFVFCILCWTVDSEWALMPEEELDVDGRIYMLTLAQGGLGRRSHLPPRKRWTVIQQFGHKRKTASFFNCQRTVSNSTVTKFLFCWRLSASRYGRCSYIPRWIILWEVSLTYLTGYGFWHIQSSSS